MKSEIPAAKTFGSLHVFGGGQWVFWGASGFFGGPVDFLIHWPPGSVVATVQCQGLLLLDGNISAITGPKTPTLYILP